MKLESAKKGEREMALRGQIINDTQPFCSVRKQNHTVGRHAHVDMYTTTHTGVLQCSSSDLEAD